MGFREALKNNEDTQQEKIQKVVPGKRTSVSVIHNNRQKKHNHRNLKQIFILSFDALRERKARSALTILMVIVGSALMVALNGLSAGAVDRPANLDALIDSMQEEQFYLFYSTNRAILDGLVYGLLVNCVLARQKHGLESMAL